MATPSHEINFLIVTHDFNEFSEAKAPVSLRVPPETNLNDLQRMIKDSCNQALAAFSTASLDIWTMTLFPLHLINFLTEALESGSIRSLSRRQMTSEDCISSMGPWPEKSLHLLVQLPAEENLSYFISPNTPYHSAFIRVTQWGSFSVTDHTNNHLRREDMSPGFVMDFLDTLDDKPLVAVNAQAEYACIRDPECQEAYFHTAKDLDAHGIPSHDVGHEAPQSRRSAECAEVHHIGNIAFFPWQDHWGAALKEDRMKEIFFSQLDIFLQQHYETSMACSFGNAPWPFSLITYRPEEPFKKRYRKYRPRSDFMITKFNFPRLLLEIASDPKEPECAQDELQILLQGASVVRFANKAVKTFNTKKNFILIVFFIASNGLATRYTLFQEGSEDVRYHTDVLDLTLAVERVKFIRQMYNLVSYLDKEGREDSMASEVTCFSQYVENSCIASFFSESTNATTKTTGDSKDSGGRPVFGGSDESELMMHGYKAKVEVEVEVEGFTPLFQDPPHIVSVHKITDQKKPLIAKKVRQDSVELKILEFLRATTPCSKHTISLLDSFYTPSAAWLILPELTPFVLCLGFFRDVVRDNALKLCSGLIEGLAYLHKLLIAHRDIKPHNLVVDEWSLCLKIIDFDLAIQLKDEDEEADDHCGTEGWTAPEITNRAPKNSPIKADRWACGKTIQYILDESGKNDTFLQVVSTKLMATDPQQRPSLLEWRNWKYDSSFSSLRS